MARDGIVLLKNTDGALPLNKPKSVAVIGSDSIVAPKGANAWYEQPHPMYMCVDLRYSVRIAAATMEPSRWAGAVEPQNSHISLHHSTPLRHKRKRTARQSPPLPTITRSKVLQLLRTPTMPLSTSTRTPARDTSPLKRSLATATILIRGTTETVSNVPARTGYEAFTDFVLQCSDLVKAVAAVNKKTIVVIHSVGPLILEPYIDNPNVVAVVWAGLPGMSFLRTLSATAY
jgi:beta-glucosidase